MSINIDHSNAGTITLKPATTGNLSLTLPSADGTNGQALTTDGAGKLTFANIATATNVTGIVAIANGGTGATTAATALTALGAYAATNPSGYTSNTGTVTSVGGTGTVSGLTLSGTVTTSGNLTLGGTLAVTASNFASQTANTILAAPTGVAGVPTFRSLVAADIPTLNQNTTGTASNVTGTVAIANGGTGATTAATARTALGLTTTATTALSSGGGGAGVVQIGSDGVVDTGRYLDFHAAGGDAVDFTVRLDGGAAGSTTLSLTGSFSASGNITAYSDERLKTNWNTLPVDFIQKLAKVKSGTYTRIDNGERQAGSSAQDWQTLLPEVVITNNDDAKTLALAYGNAALVSAVELAKRVVDQEARIAQLELLVNSLIK